MRHLNVINIGKLFLRNEKLELTDKIIEEWINKIEFLVG